MSVDEIPARLRPPRGDGPRPVPPVGQRADCCRIPSGGLPNGDAHTASFQTLAGRRPHAELAHLRPFSAHRTAASPLPFQWPWLQRSRTDSTIIVTAAFAVLFFGLGSYLGARPSVDPQQELAALRTEIDLLRKQQELAPAGTAGIAPPPPVVETPVFDNEKRAAIVADVKLQLQTEMGLLPLALIRDRRQSFVELYSYDDRGASSYGTAGYLGNGYFITVKHGVVALGQEGASDPRVINSVKLMIDGRPISARVVDAGDARVEVDPGDWAILKVKENIDLPALNVGLNYQFEFADPIFRLGNDYSKGIVVSTGYVGQRHSQQAGHLFDGRPPRRVRRRCAERRGSARGHSRRPNAGGFPILVHSSASRRDVPEGEVRARSAS